VEIVRVGWCEATSLADSWFRSNDADYL